MNVFWYARRGNGQYTIGLGATAVISIDAPDDALGSQWAQCCANALNTRERKLRQQAANSFSPLDVVYNEDGTVNEAKSAANEAKRDRYEANAD